jgi:hypothetical protein
VNYTWTDEEANYNTEHKVDPTINSYTSEPVNKLREIAGGTEAEGRKLQCSKCGAVTEAACDCQVEYKSVPGERARKAVEATPGKSNRAIAEEIGVSYETVRRARPSPDTNVSGDPGQRAGDTNVSGDPGRRSSIPHGTGEVRIGKDGKRYRTPTPKSKLQHVTLSPVSAIVVDLSFLSVDDRQRVEAIIHRVEQQSNNQIKALAKENADLRTRIQELKHEYKQSMDEWLKGSLVLTSTPSSHSPVQEPPASCSIPPVQESLASCSIPPAQESLASDVNDINPATGRRWKRLKDFLPYQDSISSPASSSSISPVQESGSHIPPVSGIFPVSSVSTPSPPSPILPVQESTSPTSPASPISLVPEPSPSPSSIRDEEAIVSSISSPIPSGTKKKSKWQELAENWRSIPDPDGDKVRAEIRKRLEERS